MLSTCDSRIKCISARWVSSFGNFRIKGCLAPPRNISPPRRVLHRLSKPRHPPYALICFSLLCWERRNLRTAIICCSPYTLSKVSRLSTWYKDLILFFMWWSIYASSKRPAGSGYAVDFSFQRISNSSDLAQKKPLFRSGGEPEKGLPSTS